MGAAAAGASQAQDGEPVTGKRAVTGKTAPSLGERGDREAVGEGTLPGPDPSARQTNRRHTRAAVQCEEHLTARLVPANLGYAFWAATYDRDPNPLLALEERVLSPRLPDVRNKTVLDVGCGTGRWLISLVQREARWGVGIDLSTAMLRCAVSKSPPGAWLVRADASALPVQRESIDLVLCSFTIGHICSLSRPARELARVARKGADIYVSGLHPEARARGWRCAFRHGAGTVEIPEFDEPLEVILRSFEATGFESVSLLEPCFGSEERPIFVKGNKAAQFEAATTVPAIFVSHFRRV